MVLCVFIMDLKTHRFFLVATDHLCMCFQAFGETQLLVRRSIVVLAYFVYLWCAPGVVNVQYSLFPLSPRPIVEAIRKKQKFLSC